MACQDRLDLLVIQILTGQSQRFTFFFFHFHFHYHSGTVNHNTPPIQRPTAIICERTTVKQTHSLSGPAKWVNWKKIILRHN